MADVQWCSIAICAQNNLRSIRLFGLSVNRVLSNAFGQRGADDHAEGVVSEEASAMRGALARSALPSWVLCLAVLHRPYCQGCRDFQCGFGQSYVNCDWFYSKPASQSRCNDPVNCHLRACLHPMQNSTPFPQCCYQRGFGDAGI